MENNRIEMLKKMHSARAIKRKDFSFKHIFEGSVKEIKPDENRSIILEIIGFESKFVPKYEKDTNSGFHTTIFLKNGKTTGAFSNALNEFANFFYEGAGLDINDTFKKIDFLGAADKAGFIKVQVTKIDLDSNKTTYEFVLLDGEVEGLKKLQDSFGAMPLQLTE